MIFESKPFGPTGDGSAARLYTLTDDSGMAVGLTDLGAAIVSIVVTDRSGRPGDVVLGYDTAAEYACDPFYFGATIGRYANRIAGGRLVLKKSYPLSLNETTAHLHGGHAGFNRVLWEATPYEGTDVCGVEFRYLSRDGEEGCPGNLAATVRFTLSRPGDLSIHYTATTDSDTVVNLTNHAYFNLSGAGKGDILAHRLQLFADRFTPVNRDLVPTGELRQVADTLFDFRQPRAIGGGLPASDRQLRIAGGYDHNFVLNRTGSGLCEAARVYDPDSGRTLEVATTQPGVQLYTGHGIAAGTPGKEGHRYSAFSGFCLETQHFPDSPNRPEFPSVLLRAGETYRQETVYRFAVDPCRQCNHKEAAPPGAHPKRPFQDGQ